MLMRSRVLFVALMLIAAGGFLAVTFATRANAAEPCQQAYATLTYHYTDSAPVPEGVVNTDAAQSDSTFGPDSGLPGCQDFTNRLDARKSTLTDTDDAPQTIKVVVTGFDLTVSPDQCDATVGSQHLDMTVVPDSNGTTATLATLPAPDYATTYAGSFSGAVVDTPITIPVTVDCGTLGVWHPDLVVNATPEPSGTSLTINTGAAKAATLTAHRPRHPHAVEAAGTEVSGKLIAVKPGFNVAGQTVLVQHKVGGVWSKVGSDTTSGTGRYDVVVTDTTHLLRTHYVATLRLLHSYSSAS